MPTLVYLHNPHQAFLGAMVKVTSASVSSGLGWLMGVRGGIATVRRPDGSTFTAHGSGVHPIDGPSWDERPSSITYHVECHADGKSWWEPVVEPVYQDGEAQLRLGIEGSP